MQGGTGRPDGHRTQRGIVRMCMFVLCALYAGTRGKFHAPPQIKPEGTERKSGKKCKRVDVGTVHKDTVYASKAKWERGETGLEKTPNGGEEDESERKGKRERKDETVETVAETNADA